MLECGWAGDVGLRYIVPLQAPDLDAWYVTGTGLTALEDILHM